jgi:hypothetical protein
MSERADETLSVLNRDGGYIGAYPFTEALELAGECACYAVDAEALQVVSHVDGTTTREPLPAGVIEWVDLAD